MKKEGKNSTYVLFDLQNCEIGIRFHFKLRTHKTFCKVKEHKGEDKEVKPEYVICNPIPSTMTMSYGPS